MKNKVLPKSPFKKWLGRTFIFTDLLLTAYTMVAFINTTIMKRNPDSYFSSRVLKIRMDSNIEKMTLEEKIREELCKNLLSLSACIYIPEYKITFFDIALQSIAFLEISAKELKAFKNVLLPLEKEVKLKILVGYQGYCIENVTELKV